VNELTVKELAAVERVSERTVWNWIAKGALDVRRTPGGGVRIRDSRVAVLTLSALKSSAIDGNPSS
jgi:excisionase family DNA binding protein